MQIPNRLRKLSVNITNARQNSIRISKLLRQIGPRVLCRMFDGIEYRGYGQEIVEELARHSTVPVWNGLTNEYHPTQMLADMLTAREKFGTLKKLKLVYFGDARYNIGNSLCVVCAKIGLDLVLCTNKKYFPAKELLADCKPWCEESGGSISLEENVEKAAQGADIIYTDVWVSMGERDEIWAERIADLKPYQVTKKIMSLAKPSAIFMHDLPSFHDLNTDSRTRKPPPQCQDRTRRPRERL